MSKLKNFGYNFSVCNVCSLDSICNCKKLKLSFNRCFNFSPVPSLVTKNYFNSKLYLFTTCKIKKYSNFF